MEEPLRLTSSMASRKLLVLAFVRAFIERWQGSPSIGEIAEAVGASRGRVHAVLCALEKDKLIVRRKGARGIMLPDRLSEAVRELRAAGYIVDEDVLRGSITRLPPVVELDYDPG
jgi:DNA-binding MarR family transcriptional regulator